MPNSESDFGVSEEVEICIYNKSVDIINNSKNHILQDLRYSCLEAKQENSVEFLKSVLQTLNCIKTDEDVFSHFAQLCKSKFYSIFKLQYNIEADKTIRLCIDATSPGLYSSYYTDPHIMKHYNVLLEHLEKEFDWPLKKTLALEKAIMYRSNEYSSEDKYKIKGSKLPHKFPGIPWKLWFQILGIEGWGKMTMYYTSPRWIRYIGKIIRQVPVEYWKIYLARCYIINSLKYLPAPYSTWDYEFFGKATTGQKEMGSRQEILVAIVYDYLYDMFSKIFWEEAGEPKLVPEIRKFASRLVESAKHRLLMTEWLKPATRAYAAKKVDKMAIETVRPDEWAPMPRCKLDSKNLLKNIFLLGEMNVQNMIERVGQKYKYWEEGIYRVNAYYFNENNEMMIPYGTCLFPFYKRGALGFSYGALGSIIGHEMCHGFDNDGKDYDFAGVKKKWWTPSDNREYHERTKSLIKLFSAQKVEGKHVDGERTLSENIADLGGVGISLHALKQELQEKNIFEAERVKEEYKNFFISFATSWRTKYRHTKLKTSLGIDYHAPAFLRVNLVVPQFDEWYYAFDVKKGDALWIEPEERIRIF